MQQKTLREIRDNIQDLIQIDLAKCFDYLIKILEDGNKKTDVIRWYAEFKNINRNLDTITSDDISRRYGIQRKSLLELAEGLTANEIKPQFQEISGTNEYEIWVFCWLSQHESFWTEAFEELKIPKFRFKKPNNLLPSTAQDIILLLDPRGIEKHENALAFIKLPPDMQDFMWFVLDIAINTPHEKLYYGDFSSFVFEKYCGGKIRRVNNLTLGDQIKKCVERITKRQDRQEQLEL